MKGENNTQMMDIDKFLREEDGEEVKVRKVKKLPLNAELGGYSKEEWKEIEKNSKNKKVKFNNSKKLSKH